MLERIALSPRSYALLCLSYGAEVVENALTKIDKKYIEESVRCSDAKDFYAVKSVCADLSKRN
jgi:hypothetical protein